MVKDPLDLLFENIKATLKYEGRYEEDSCLISLAFEMRGNKRGEIINESGIEIGDDVSIVRLRELIDDGLVRESEEHDKYLITAMGLWNMENETLLNNGKLVAYVDRKYFTTDTKPLGDMERIVIITLIAGRAFSRENRLELHKDTLLEHWQQIFWDAYETLKSIGAVKSDDKTWDEKIRQQITNEHPLSTIMRNCGKIPKKVQRIFNLAGGQTYYLDISNENTLSDRKLAVLFKKTIGDKLTFDNMDEIVNFCNDVSMKKGPLLYSETNPFCHPKFDTVIENAVLESMNPDFT